ncbi:MAG: glucose-1-phosphate adenylyltransferase subunit GlgD [Faecalibacterium sp.]
MISQNMNALGIVFPNSYDSTVPQLVAERLMASIPFAGRYRMIDFTLSSMSNCGINNVSVVVRKNYYSLMDHLGAGREWDLTRRRGGLNILPPFSEKNVKLYNGRVEALASLLPFLTRQKEKYAILSDSNLAMNFDYNKLIAEHQRTGADVTLAYQVTEVPSGLKSDNYYTITCDGEGRVTDLLMNEENIGQKNLCMNIYVIEREKLIQLVKDATVRGMVYFERDILAHNLTTMNIRGMQYNGYVARICDMKTYFDENLKLIEEENLDALFPRTSPVYTKIRDDNPTRYAHSSHVESSLIADGCCIKGRVENCVLFRGVTVKKGATVRNCVLMQDTVVEENVNLECVVADKNVTFTANKQLFGTESFPIFVGKRHTV